ncbi:MAG TPA: CHASE3 domain-containing protein, partial [Nevskiaceae bacterium]|nr:CHASE3 domain-containing protein [Nevskiaceae bacterium]
MIGAAYRWVESMPVRGKLLLSHAMVVALLFILAGVFVATQSAVENAGAWAEHSREVLRSSTTLRSAVAAEEAAARAWLLSGEAVLKDEFATHAQHVDAQLDHLQRLTNDNATQQRNLERLDVHVGEWRAAIQALSVLSAAAADSDEAMKRVRSASAALPYASLDAFEAEEQRLMQERER